MRRIVFLAIALAAATGFAAMVEQDMMELRVQGHMDFSNPRGHTQTDLELGLGYFILDDIQIGGLIGFANEQDKVGFGLGAYSEVMFDLYYAVAPFIGGGFQFRFGDVYTANHLLIEFNGGARLFLTEYLAVSGTAYFQIATDDVFVRNYRERNNDAGLRLGLNVYF